MLGYIYMQGMPKQKQEPFILVIFGTIVILINKMHHIRSQGFTNINEELFYVLSTIE